MKKIELIYLHGLLDLIRVVMRKRDDLPDGSLDSYQELGTAPTAVYQPKDEHEVAVETLAATLATASESTEQLVDQPQS